MKRAYVRQGGRLSLWLAWFFWFSLTGKRTRRGDGGGLGWAAGGRNVRFAELQTRRMQGGLAWLARRAFRAVCIAAAGRCSLPAFQDDGEVLLCEEGCTGRIAKRGCGILKTLLLARGGSGGMRVRTWCDLSISPCLTAAFYGGGGGGGNVVYCQV